MSPPLRSSPSTSGSRSLRFLELFPFLDYVEQFILMVCEESPFERHAAARVVVGDPPALLSLQCQLFVATCETAGTTACRRFHIAGLAFVHYLQLKSALDAFVNPPLFHLFATGHYGLLMLFSFSFRPPRKSPAHFSCKGMSRDRRCQRPQGLKKRLRPLRHPRAG